MISHRSLYNFDGLNRLNATPVVAALDNYKVCANLM